MQVYAPELNKRCRPYLKPTNKSYRIDETYIKVKGQDKYLYRALDSTGQTIDFLLTAKRDAAAAKRFLRRAIEASGNPMPRVMNVDKNPAYPAAVETLKAEGSVPRRVAGRSPSWPEAGLATKAASRSAIFFRKYSTRFMMRCPFYRVLRSPVPSSIINFSRKHQFLNVNSRTTRPAFLRAARVPTSPQSNPSKWR